MGHTYLLVSHTNISVVQWPLVGVNVTTDPPFYYTNDLQSAWFDPVANVTRGWFHLDLGTDPKATYFVSEITYAESADNGKTYIPRQFDRFKRDRVIISAQYKLNNKDYVKTAAQIAESGTDNGGVGAHWVIEMGSFLYMYFIDMWAEMDDGSHHYGMCIARASKISGGVPGSWFKWYRGSFSQPGRAGECSVIDNIMATAVIKLPGMAPVNTDFYYAMAANPSVNSASLDGLNWINTWGAAVPPQHPIVDKNNPYDRSTRVGYFSVVRDNDNQLWLYGVLSDYFRPLAIRNIVRWPISFSLTPVKMCGNRVALTRFRDVRTGFIRVTWLPIDTKIYEPIDQVAYVSACFGNGFKRLVNCMVSSTNIHFLTWESNCTRTSPSPDGKPLIFYGALGNILPVQMSGLVPLYRCFHPNTSSYDAAVGDCTFPLVIDALLGYTMPIGSNVSTFSTNFADPFFDPSYPQVLDPDNPLFPIPRSRKLADESVANSSPAASLSSVATAGLSIGGLCVGLILVAVVLYLTIKRRRRVQNTSDDADTPPVSPSHTVTVSDDVWAAPRSPLHPVTVTNPRTVVNETTVWPYLDSEGLTTLELRR